jgi:hypothetical protein
MRVDAVIPHVGPIQFCPKVEGDREEGGSGDNPPSSPERELHREDVTSRLQKESVAQAVADEGFNAVVLRGQS